MTRFLLDTSVWISWFNGDESVSSRLATLIDPDDAEVWSCGPVRLELLKGSGDADHELIRETLNLIPTAAVTEADFDDAASIYRLTRSRGHTVRSSLDCLIAAVALRLDLIIVHRDIDFARMSRAMPALATRDLTS